MDFIKLATFTLILTLGLIYFAGVVIINKNYDDQYGLKYFTTNDKKMCNYLSYFYDQFGEEFFGRRQFTKGNLDLLIKHGFVNTEIYNCFNSVSSKGGISDRDKVVLKSKPIFLTGLSDNHFIEGKIMLQKLIDVYKGCWTRWVIYDLGLNLENRDAIVRQFKDCKPEIKSLNLSAYPVNFKDLTQYRWKPVLIAEELKISPAILWIDTSSHHNTPLPFLMHNTKCLENPAPNCTLFHWLLTFPGGHNIFSTTMPKMFDYLPMPSEQQYQMGMFGANIMLIYNTSLIRTHILPFWLLCAFEEECMAPKGSQRFCEFPTFDRMSDFAKCHRYDQSAINIILANYFQWDTSKYVLMNRNYISKKDM